MFTRALPKVLIFSLLCMVILCIFLIQSQEQGKRTATDLRIPYINTSNKTKQFEKELENTAVKTEKPEKVKLKDEKSPLIKLNKCPPHYTFPENLFYKYDKIKQISNYSLSNRSSTKYNFNQHIVILVPISNSEPFLLHFFRLMCSLTYPHELISIVFGEDSSSDNTYKTALIYAEELRPYFKNVSVHHFDIVIKKPEGVHRHSTKYQLPRRMHMAKSRNLLLFKGLKDEDDVALWIDVDVKYYPRDIIEHLLSEDKDVITPACMQVARKGIVVYDLNNWQDTPQSLLAIKHLDEDYLRVESSGIDIKRLYLHMLGEQTHIVPLDGVGGCLLMVKARCHRLGLNFPTFIYKNQIETEGLALFAKKMGFSVYGLPRVHILHTIA